MKSLVGEILIELEMDKKREDKENYNMYVCMYVQSIKLGNIIFLPIFFFRQTFFLGQNTA